MSYHDLILFSNGAENCRSSLAGWRSGSSVGLKIANRKKCSLELIDHGTSELFSSLANWSWKISPRRTHVVGATWSDYSSPKPLSQPDEFPVPTPT